MASYSDSDMSSESEYDSDQESTPESECDENESLEPEPNAEEFVDGVWNPVAQLHATQLLQLHRNIQVYKAITFLLFYILSFA